MGWFFSIGCLVMAVLSPRAANDDIFRCACIIASGLFAISGSISVGLNSISNIKMNIETKFKEEKDED